MKNTTKNEGVISRFIFPTSRYIPSVQERLRKRLFVYPYLLCLPLTIDDHWMMMMNGKWNKIVNFIVQSYNNKNNETCLQSIELLPAWHQTLPTPLFQIG